MRVRLSGSTITAHGDNLGAPYVEFPGNEPLGFSTDWTVSGSAPHRKLLDPHGHEYSVELPTQTAPGGGSGVTVDNGVDAPAAVTTLVAPGADVSTPGSATLSSTIVVSASDPGAIGAKNLWLEVVFADGNGDGGDGRLWVRNSTDTGWNSASPLTFSDATTTLIASPADASEVVLNDSGGSHVSDPTSFYINGGGKAIFLDAAGLHLGGSALGPLVISAGTPDDPRSGGGLAAPKGSIFANSSTAFVWYKTGAGATAWAQLIQVASPEGVADLAGDADLPTTVAKVNQLLTALRAINVVG